MRTLVLLAMLSMTAACAPTMSPSPSAPPPPPPAPPPPAPPATPPPMDRVSAPGGGFDLIPNAQVGRAYLVGDEEYQPYEGNLPFGVILLRQNEESRSLNRALCESFVENIQPTGDIDPRINIIATYWMLTRSLSPGELTDCNALLTNYNFARAEQIYDGYEMEESRGPVFLALQLNRGLDLPADVFLLDLSQRTPDDITRITANWFDVVVTEADAETGNEEVATPASRTGARGWFRALRERVAPLAGGAIRWGCDIIRDRAPDTSIAYFNIEYVDPFLNDVRGTLRRIVHSNTTVSMGLAFVSRLCPQNAAVGPDPVMIFPPLTDFRHAAAAEL